MTCRSKTSGEQQFPYLFISSGLNILTGETQYGTTGRLGLARYYFQHNGQKLQQVLPEVWNGTKRAMSVRLGMVGVGDTL